MIIIKINYINILRPSADANVQYYLQFSAKTLIN